MRSFLVFVFISLLSLECSAQFYELNLVVINSANNATFSDANIRLSDKYFVTTNNLGKAQFKNIPGGNYLLHVTYVGYKDYESEIEIISDTSITIRLSQSNIKLNDIIVISSKYEKEINLLPYSVSIIDKSDIQRNTALSVPDLLKTESGISLARDGIWGTEVNIRGLSRANVVTLIDGNRVETSTDISARLSMVDLNDIERVEVIKGAASSLYGTGATGGIVNIISKDGSYDPNFNIHINYLVGYKTVNNLFSNGINIYSSNNNWMAKVSAAYRKADNTKTPLGVLTNSQFQDYNLSAIFQYKLFDNQEIKINYQQFKAIDVGIPGGNTLFPTSAIVTYPNEERQLYSLEYKINNLSKSFIKLYAKYFHQFILRDVNNIPGITQFVAGTETQPPKRINVLEINPGANHNVEGAQAQADFSFNNHYLIAGLDFWKRNYDGLRTKDLKTEILNPTDSSIVKTSYSTIYEKPIPDANYYSAGLYLQDDFKFSEKLNFTLGGRYDYIWLNNKETYNPLYTVVDGITINNPPGQKLIWPAQKTDNNSYSINLGMVYNLNAVSNISLNASRSFRSPSLEERYQYIDLGSVIRVGNPDLKPEQGYYFDLGYRIFDHNISFNPSLFLNTLTDLVSEVPAIYEDRNAYVKVNIGSALLYGFDYSFTYDFSVRLNVYNNLSYVRGINRNDDDNLSQIPPINTLIGIKYFLFPWLGVDLSSQIFAAQNKIAEGEIATPGYLITNVRFDFEEIKIGSFNLMLTAGVENFLNKNYRNHLSTNRGLVVSEPGRNYYIRTNISF